ncbi:MAG: HupE/UreJ family protein [Rhodoferax sp.]
MRSRFLNAIFLLAIYAISTRASAHIGVHDIAQTGFWTGFVHPLTGLDHLAAMVTVGLWSALAARRAGPELLWGPMGFASLLLVGAVMGLQGVALPAVEPMIAASLLLLGLLVVTRRRMPGVTAAALVGAFAIFHGVAHSTELAEAGNAWQTLAGMLAATFLLHATGLGLGWALRSANAWLPRVVGTAVAVFGSALLLQLT